jgi:hypothetical protein
MLVLSDYLTSGGYAVDKEKTSRECVVPDNETTDDKIVSAADCPRCLL